MEVVGVVGLEHDTRDVGPGRAGADFVDHVGGRHVAAQHVNSLDVQLAALVLVAALASLDEQLIRFSARVAEVVGRPPVRNDWYRMSSGST